METEPGGVPFPRGWNPRSLIVLVAPKKLRQEAMGWGGWLGRRAGGSHQVCLNPDYFGLNTGTVWTLPPPSNHTTSTMLRGESLA